MSDIEIAIESDNDTGLFDKHQMFSLVSVLSFKKFNYFIQFNDSFFTDHTKSLSI